MYNYNYSHNRGAFTEEWDKRERERESYNLIK